MRTCLRIPRILLPREGFETWAVIACDQFSSDREYWRRVERCVGDAPSTLNFILPEADLGEDDAARIEEIRAAMYSALENDALSKLTRGLIFTERTTRAGVRRGILVCIDLEAFSAEEGVMSPVRASEQIIPGRLSFRVALRRATPLEFPHTLVFYRDKKDKAVKSLLREELEKLYDFDLMEGGGHLTGWFVPDYIAADVVNMLHTKGDPVFAVADGNHAVAAAKQYWEELKPTLRQEELGSHPARFTFVEMVNICDPAVVFHPIHRLVKDVETEAFCDFVMRSVKCKREGNVITGLPAGIAGVRIADELCEKFVRAGGGRIDYVHGTKRLQSCAAEEDCAGILLTAMDKEDFFPALKGGALLPKKAFSLGMSKEKRYYLEGREISYD